jgi:hypothetical protein
LRLRGGRASKSRLPGHFDETFIPLNPGWLALVPRGWVGRESIILPFQRDEIRHVRKGQNKKHSTGANVFRSSPKNGRLARPKTSRGSNVMAFRISTGSPIARTWRSRLSSAVTLRLGDI